MTVCVSIVCNTQTTDTEQSALRTKNIPKMILQPFHYRTMSDSQIRTTISSMDENDGGNISRSRRSNEVSPKRQWWRNKFSPGVASKSESTSCSMNSFHSLRNVLLNQKRSKNSSENNGASKRNSSKNKKTTGNNNLSFRNIKNFARTGSWRFGMDSGKCYSNLSKNAQKHLNIPLDDDDYHTMEALQLLEQDNDDRDSTHCNSESTPTSTGGSSFSSSSFSVLGLKSCLKVKTLQDSLAVEDSKDAAAQGKANSIHFSKVTIQYHDLVLGDHPQVSGGAPLALGCWESSEEVSVSQHERERLDRCEKVPWKERSTLTVVARERMLVQAGVSYRSIRQRITRMKILKDLQMRSCEKGYEV